MATERPGHVVTSLLLSLTVLAAACDVERYSSPAAPSSLAEAFLGVWHSSSAQLSADRCANFEWHAVSQYGDSVTGEFSASCNDGLQLVGMATGTLADGVLHFTATGEASVPGSAACAFSMNGTAVLDGDEIRIDYTGTTCLAARGRRGDP